MYDFQNSYLDTIFLYRQILDSSIELDAIQRKGGVIGRIIEDTNDVYCIDPESNKKN